MRLCLTGNLFRQDLIHCILERFTRLETRDGCSGNVDLSTGPWVTSLTRRPVLHRKRAETHQ